MAHLVVSGFDRFGPYRENPSEIVCGRLNGRRLLGFEVTSQVFRCEIADHDRGRQLLGMAAELGARGIVCLGVASEKTGLCVESKARNGIDNQKYCLPEQVGTKVDASAEYGATVDVDLAAWNFGPFRDRCIAQGVPVMELSIDAGGFCCNQLLYQLTSARLGGIKDLATPYIFIHVPCSPESVADSATFKAGGKVLMSIDKVIEGVKLLLETASL